MEFSAETLSEAKLEMPHLEATAETEELRSFFHTLAAASHSALLLDFDGTLAPFRRDPAKVRPWAGVPALLNQIQQTGKTRIVLVSGRPAQNVASQLALATPLEAWGLHGAERLWPDGRVEFEKLPLRQQLLLNAARTALQEGGYLTRQGVRLEAKWNAVVLHWRGLPARQAAAVREGALRVLRPIADEGAFEVLLFDGGIEMRAGRTKGDTMRLLLAEMSAQTPVAYLGDDITDEHAFHAIEGRGLSVLVRRQWRPTAAHLWLRPPAGLRIFLREWLRAVQNNIPAR